MIIANKYSDAYINFLGNLSNYCMEHNVKISGNIVVEDFKMFDEPIKVSFTDRTENT